MGWGGVGVEGGVSCVEGVGVEGWGGVGVEGGVSCVEGVGVEGWGWGWGVGGWRGGGGGGEGGRVSSLVLCDKSFTKLCPFLFDTLKQETPIIAM